MRMMFVCSARRPIVGGGKQNKTKFQTLKSPVILPMRWWACSGAGGLMTKLIMESDHRWSGMIESGALSTSSTTEPCHAEYDIILPTLLFCFYFSSRAEYDNDNERWSWWKQIRTLRRMSQVSSFHSFTIKHFHFSTFNSLYALDFLLLHSFTLSLFKTLKLSHIYIVRTESWNWSTVDLT